MVSVGVKELKNDLSRYLQRVRRGEQVRVTVRGEHVADLVPAAPPSDDWRRELILQGRLTPASKPRSPRPSRPVKAKVSPTELVLAEREEDR